MSRPGAWLRAAAARVCKSQTLERVIDPVVTDIQTEHEQAVQAGRSGRALAVRITGYCAFWKALGLHAVLSAAQSVRHGNDPDRRTLGRILVHGGVVFVCAMLLLTAPPLFHVPGHAGLKLRLLLLPQAIPLSIPIALPIGIVWSVRPREGLSGCTRGVLALAVIAALIALAAMQMLPVANQAFRVKVAEALHRDGIADYSRGPNELSLEELARQIRQYEADGLPQRARSFEFAYHLRLALPIGAFVMGLLALGIIRVLRLRTLRIGATALALGLYWGVLAVGERSLSLPPALSAWAPNIMLAALALVLPRISAGMRAPGASRVSATP